MGARMADFSVQVTMDQHMEAIDWMELHGIVLYAHDVDDLKGMVEQVVYEEI